MFRTVASLTAVLMAVLGVFILVSPGAYMATYGVLAQDSGLFMGMRAAPMFLGVAVLLWLARQEPASSLRNALALGIAVTFAGVSGTGIFEYVTGGANAMILGAAASELLIAALFVATTRT